MYKSSVTVRAEPPKSRTIKQKDNSLQFLGKNTLQFNKVSDDSHSEADTRFTLREIKNRLKLSLVDFLKTHLHQSDPSDDFSYFEEATNINRLFENAFSTIQRATGGATDREVLVKVRAKESARIRVVREQQKKKPRTGRYEQLERTNDELKRQLYTIKEEKTQLQKRIIGLIEQFRNRKNFYLAEIKKLTDIVSFSPADLRQLVLAKTKQAQLLQHRQDRQEQPKPPIPSGIMLNFEGHNQQINILQPKKPSIAVGLSSSRREESHSRHTEFASDPHALNHVTSIQHLQEQKEYHH